MGNYLATYFGRLYISRENSDWDIAQRSRLPSENTTDMKSAGEASNLVCDYSNSGQMMASDTEQSNILSNVAGECVQNQKKRALPNSSHCVKQSKYMRHCSHAAGNVTSAEQTSDIPTEASCISTNDVSTTNSIDKLASFYQHNRILFSDSKWSSNNVLITENAEIAEYKQDVSPIQRLPSVLLIMVFRYLPLADLLHHVALVCTYWYELSRDPDLWREVNLRGQLKVTDEILQRILSYSEGIVSVDISDARSVTDCGLEALAKKCSSVICLKLMRCVQLKEPAFKAVGHYCPNLVHLYLDCCFCLSDEALATISVGCPKIRVLHINQCGILSNLGIEAVGKGCPELEDLSMDQCKQVGDPGLLAIIYGCRRLQCLSAMSCVFSSEGIMELIKLPHLQRLELHDVLGVKDDCIIKVVENCKQLETLNLSLCTRITDRSVEYIARHASNLRALYLASCDLTDKALISLGAHSRSLETLDVGWCSNITDEGAKQISEKCRTLRNLGLTRCDKVTVPTMDYLVKEYPYIHYSTFWLDCQRLMSRAQKIGLLQPQHLPK